MIKGLGMEIDINFIIKNIFQKDVLLFYAAILLFMQIVQKLIKSVSKRVMRFDADFFYFKEVLNE